MQRRDVPRDLAEPVGDILTTLETSGEPTVLGHASHGHQVIADRTIRIPQLGHAEVHVGRETTVEVDLAPTRERPGLDGREVEEPEIHGLLHLVHALTEEEQRR